MDLIPEDVETNQNTNKSPKLMKNLYKNNRHRRTKSSSGYELLEYSSKEKVKKNEDAKQNFIQLADFISNDVTTNAILKVNTNTDEKNVIIDTLEEYVSNESSRMNFMFLPTAFKNSDISGLTRKSHIGFMDRSFQQYKKNLSSNYMNLLNLNQIEEELMSEENMGSQYSRRKSKNSGSIVVKNTDNKTEINPTSVTENQKQGIRDPQNVSKFKTSFQEISLSNNCDSKNHESDFKSIVKTDCLVNENDGSASFNNKLKSCEKLFKTNYDIYHFNNNLDDSEHNRKRVMKLEVHHNKTVSANTQVHYEQITDTQLQHRHCSSLNLNKDTLSRNNDANYLYGHNKGSEECEQDKYLVKENAISKEENQENPQSNEHFNNEKSFRKDTDKNDFDDPSYNDRLKKSYGDQEMTEEIQLYNKSEQFQLEDLVNLEDESNRINSLIIARRNSKQVKKYSLIDEKDFFSNKDSASKVNKLKSHHMRNRSNCDYDWLANQNKQQSKQRINESFKNNDFDNSLNKDTMMTQNTSELDSEMFKSNFIDENVNKICSLTKEKNDQNNIYLNKVKKNNNQEFFPHKKSGSVIESKREKLSKNESTSRKEKKSVKKQQKFENSDFRHDQVQEFKLYNSKNRNYHCNQEEETKQFNDPNELEEDFAFSEGYPNIYMKKFDTKATTPDEILVDESETNAIERKSWAYVHSNKNDKNSHARRGNFTTTSGNANLQKKHKRVCSNYVGSIVTNQSGGKLQAFLEDKRIKNQSEKEKRVNLFSEIRAKKGVKKAPQLKLDDYVMNLTNPGFSATNRSQKVKKINFNENYLHKEYSSNINQTKEDNDQQNDTNCQIYNEDIQAPSQTKKGCHRRTVSDNPTYSQVKKFATKNGTFVQPNCGSTKSKVQNLNSVFGNNNTVMSYLNQSTPSKIKEFKNSIKSNNNNIGYISNETKSRHSKNSWSTSNDLPLKNLSKIGSSLLNKPSSKGTQNMRTSDATNNNTIKVSEETDLEKSIINKKKLQMNLDGATTNLQSNSVNIEVNNASTRKNNKTHTNVKTLQKVSKEDSKSFQEANLLKNNNKTNEKLQNKNNLSTLKKIKDLQYISLNTNKISFGDYKSGNNKRVNQEAQSDLKYSKTDSNQKHILTKVLDDEQSNKNISLFQKSKVEKICSIYNNHHASLYSNTAKHTNNNMDSDFQLCNKTNEGVSEEMNCASSNRNQEKRQALKKIQKIPVNTFRQKKQGSWSISLGSQGQANQFLKSTLNKDDSMIVILSKKVKELEKTLQESSTKIKTLEIKNNVLTEKLSKINDQKVWFLNKKPEKGNCKSSRNEKFEKLINSIDKNYHSFQESNEKMSCATEDDASYYHLMLSSGNREECNNSKSNKQENQLTISNQKTLEDHAGTFEKNTTNSSNEHASLFQKDKKKQKKKKFIDIEKLGLLKNDKYLALREKNRFIDKDKLKLWDKGNSKELSLNTLNNAYNQKRSDLNHHLIQTNKDQKTGTKNTIKDEITLN